MSDTDQPPPPMAPHAFYALLVLERADAHGYSILMGVRDVSGSKVGPGAIYGTLRRLEDALDEVLLAVPQRVTVGIEDLPGDDGDAVQFVDRIQTAPGGAGCTALATEDSDSDGTHDTFPMVVAGSTACFEVVAETNRTVMAASRPLVFAAHRR